MSIAPRTAEPIPGYVLKERIGVGGYGEVWSAQAPGDLAKAVKFVYGHFDDLRAARELKALHRIKEVRHPFLLSLERFEIVDGQLIIVTELADMSLKDRYEQVRTEGLGHIPREELLGYMRDAADALDYMSDNYSLQHLDVKPENLLLVGHRVKVADFGLVKELQDVTSSMMGGLTPVYASPEVFDGRPSQRSDQYSLAIVYQEMLTGVLPFPGKTAAQLASQHIHARPRLTPLPHNEQPIIARALSKDPAQRFPSCRAMVDAIANADKLRPGHLSGDRSKPRADPAGETKPMRSRSGDTEHDWQHGGKVEAAPHSPNNKTMLMGEDAGGAAEEHSRDPIADTGTCPVLPPHAPVDAARDLPPLELTVGATQLRPTLFIGVGGTATRALRQLRRQLHDRLGPASALPAIQMLLLDTDARNLFQATQGDCETALSDRETLPMPLRNARDYTGDAAHKLQWLSRRWLYNIPRSLQTEGRRPLGRLALVDHSERVMERLRTVLASITSPEAIAATTQATGLEFSSQVPRVFLISSISGGTGGGMVLDLAYAIRTVLADFDLDDDGVCGILTHSTDRTPTTADLAIANAYACLSELYHYGGPGCYPGEPACGLPSFAAFEGTFPHAYLVHLGENLNDQQFDLAIGSLASYLYLNSVTSAAAAFDEGRRQLSEATERGSLRTFGLLRVGSLQTALPALATERLCCEVVDRWRGMATEPARAAVGPLLAELAAQRGTPAPRVVAPQPAADHAIEQGLSLEPLCQQVRELLEHELGGDAEHVLLELGGAQADKSAAEERAYVEKVLIAMGDLFGPLTVSEDAAPAGPAAIETAIEDQLRELAAPRGAAVRDWILTLIEQPAVRVAGAARARQWYDSHLRAIDVQCHEHVRDSQQLLLAIEQTLRAAAAAAPGRGRSLFGGRNGKMQAEIERGLAELLRLRLERATHQALIKVVRQMLSQVSAAGDRIADVQRELSQINRDFSKPSPWDNMPDAGGVPAIDAVNGTIAESLHRRMPELVQVVDLYFQQNFLAPRGGLRKVCQGGNAARADLMSALRAAARGEILKALKDAPIDQSLLGADAEDPLHGLRDCLQAARPALNRCGGSQRLLAIAPATTTQSPLAEALAHDLDPPATVVRDAEADLVLCYEVQELWPQYAASRLVDGRGDLVRIAARLHTRTDVTWSELAHAPAPEVACSESV
ncbi:MAG: tubulin-like doman-containing protein [Pirellulales bacterium]